MLNHLEGEIETLSRYRNFRTWLILLIVIRQESVDRLKNR